MSDRFVSLLMLLGGINLFGMFNFIRCCCSTARTSPGALRRGGTARIAKLLRRPDLGYFDVAKLLPVAYVMPVSSS